jgi:hypothetical protein
VPVRRAQALEDRHGVPFRAVTMAISAQITPAGRAAERKPKTPGGTRKNSPCACGCGFPTAQPNGYVRGHTPKRR